MLRPLRNYFTEVTFIQLSMGIAGIVGVECKVLPFNKQEVSFLIKRIKSCFIRG